MIKNIKLGNGISIRMFRKTEGFPFSFAKAGRAISGVVGLWSMH